MIVYTLVVAVLSLFLAGSPGEITEHSSVERCASLYFSSIARVHETAEGKL